MESTVVGRKGTDGAAESLLKLRFEVKQHTDLKQVGEFSNHAGTSPSFLTLVTSAWAQAQASREGKAVHGQTPSLQLLMKFTQILESN